MTNTTPIKMPSRGYYTLSKVDAEGFPRTEGCPSNTVDNVVTYEGAYYTLFAPRMFDTLYAELGTSTTERVLTDSTLGSPVSGRSGGGSGGGRAGKEVDNLDGTSTITITRQMAFNLGDKVGTFSEVGVYSSASVGTFIAGQLIKDEFGAPTTVTVLADEQLIVTYTLEWTVPNKSVEVGSGSVTDAASNSYSYEIWAQPYFRDYSINASSIDTRYNFDGSVTVFYNASGTRITAAVPGVYSTPTRSNGTVTVEGLFGTISPTDASFTDAVFVGMQARNTTSLAGSIVDTDSALIVSTANVAIAAVVKFLNPISKTSSESFRLQISLTMNI